MHVFDLPPLTAKFPQMKPFLSTPDLTTIELYRSAESAGCLAGPWRDENGLSSREAYHFRSWDLGTGMGEA